MSGRFVYVLLVCDSSVESLKISVLFLLGLFRHAQAIPAHVCCVIS